MTDRRGELLTIKALADELGQDFVSALEDVRDARSDLRGEAAPNLPGAGEPPIAFVHIPKTAGGSATSMLAQAFTKSALYEAGNYMKGPEATVKKVDKRGGGWAGWQRRGGRVIVGHVPYGIFAERLPAETRYMVFLREPVDRVLSHYHRHIHETEVDSVPIESLEQALELGLPQVSNLLTRFLCSGAELPSEPLHPGALEEAKQNLSGFAFVGIQERFDESLVLLQRLLGLELIPYVNRHVSTERPDVEEIPPEQRALILEHNELDAALYEFALDLFDETMADAGAEIVGDAERLRGLSAETNEKTLSDAAAFLDRELPEGSSRTVISLRGAAREQGISPLAIKQVSDRFSVKLRNDDKGERIWVREPEEDLKAALELFDRILPEGVAKPKHELTAAAEEAGVPYPAFKRARDLLSISKGVDESGQRFWKREAGVQVSGAAASR